MQNTVKQNYRAGSITSYETRPGNEIGLFYNALVPSPGGTARIHKEFFRKVWVTDQQ